MVKGSAAASPRSGSEPPASLSSGRAGASSVEDRYQSLFVIGRGGMGSVEVALERGEGGYERIVALKRMLPETSRDARHKEMFLREAKLAALLAHPNVVHAFSFGELHGELFLAMEYVEGEPLSDVLAVARDKEGGLVAALAAHVLAEICDGLHAAHELRDANGNPLNVVHRDVSPHNVMVAYEGRVKLLDFGVAKFDTGGAHTRTGEVKGRMGYMSPEQALGEPLDRRSDLFSIGAVLYECISGRRMWGEGTDLEIMRKLALEEPPTLDGHPNAPPALVDLHRRLVLRAPSERPATARAVADELRACVAASGTRPDVRIVRAVMTRLFSIEAAKQREALTLALEQAAPSRVDELRKSLDPQSVHAQHWLMSADRSVAQSSDVAMATRDESEAPSASRAPRRLAAVTVIAILLAGAVATALALRPSLASRESLPRPTALTPAPAPPPAPSLALSPAPSLALSPALSPALAPALSTTATSNPKTRSPAPPPSTKRAPRPPPTTKAPPDVDPTPF
jgi:serine/threonine protein kinase